MVFEDSNFFSDNIAYINRLVTKVLYVTNLLGPLFFILTKFHIFEIELKYCILTSSLTFFYTLVQSILVFGFGKNNFKQQLPEIYDCIQKIAMYFGMIFASIMMGILGSHPHIGIYISYALVVFLSCLYYDMKIFYTSTVICYVVLLISLYFKSVNRIAEGMVEATVLNDFISYAVGFTLEYAFVVMITTKLTKRNHNSMEIILDKNIKIENTNIEIMQFIPEILKKHEIITGFHTAHTVTYVNMICQELKSEGRFLDYLTDENIKLYSAAANLHDIGKIFIPDHILNTPRRYTPQEYEMMKLHPEKGKEIIESMPQLWDGKFNKIAIDMAYCHHERYDGTGYPNGLKGEEIPVCARIMSVADVLDALLSRRPYKKEMSLEDAMRILSEGKGTQFDSVIVDAVIALKPLIYMYSQEVATKEYDIIEKELNWRQQNMDSLEKGLMISEEKQKEMMQNS